MKSSSPTVTLPGPTQHLEEGVVHCGGREAMRWGSAQASPYCPGPPLRLTALWAPVPGNVVLAALETLFLPPGPVSRELYRLTRDGICSRQKFHWGLNKRTIFPWGERGGSQGELPLKGSLLNNAKCPYEQEKRIFRSPGTHRKPKIQF